MIDHPLAYLDMAPLRLRLQPGESFSGYLTRIADHYRLPSVNSLSDYLFPASDYRVAREITDFPPVSFGVLPQKFQLSLPALRQTTLYHAGCKFGRSTQPQALSRFLSGSLSAGLRYCPHCVREYDYYRLIWRFRAVTGCPEHGCGLLEHCPSCASAFPLYQAPLRIGVCPFCDADLRAAVAPPLDDHQWRQAQDQSADYTYLIQPQPWERYADQVVATMGRYLLFRRQVAGLTARGLGRQIGVSTAAIEGIDCASIQQRGFTLVAYQRTAAYFGLSLRELFGIGLSSQPENWDYEAYQRDLRRQRVERALDRLLARRDTINYATVSRESGIPASTLRWDDHLRRLIERYRT